MKIFIASELLYIDFQVIILNSHVTLKPKIVWSCYLLAYLLFVELNDLWN